MNVNFLLALSILLPIIASIIRARSHLAKDTVLLSFLICCLVCDLLSFSRLGQSLENSDTSLIYFILQTILIPLFFVCNKRIESNYSKLVLLYFIIGTALSFGMVISYFFYNEIPTIYYALSSILILICCATYFMYELNYSFDKELWRSGTFYIIAGFYIYHSAVAIIYLTMMQLTVDEVWNIWPIKMMGYVIQNTFLFLGIVIQKSDQ